MPQTEAESFAKKNDMQYVELTAKNFTEVEEVSRMNNGVTNRSGRVDNDERGGRNKWGLCIACTSRVASSWWIPSQAAMLL